MDLEPLVSEFQLAEWRNETLMHEWAQEELPEEAIRTYGSPSRSNHTDLVNETVNEIEELEATFIFLRKLLLQRRRELEQKLTRQKAVISPFRSVPYEVLLHILEEHFNCSEAKFTGSVTHCRFSARIAPIQVCRNWRRAATESVACWSTLKIVFDINRGEIDILRGDQDLFKSNNKLLLSLESLLSHQISLSAGIPFSVEISSTAHAESHKMFESGMNIPSRINKILVGYFPYMRSYKEANLASSTPSQTRIIHSSSKTLMHLSLISSIPIECPFSSLQTLIITGLSFVHIGHLRLLDCPNLTKLHIELFNGTVNGLQTTLVEKLPRLQEFELLRFVSVHEFIEIGCYEGEEEEEEEEGESFNNSWNINHVNIKHAVLPTDWYISPIGGMLGCFPNLTSLGICLLGTQVKLRLVEPESNPNSLMVANKLETISFEKYFGGHYGTQRWEEWRKLDKWDECDNWHNISELSHFSNVARLKIYPISHGSNPMDCLWSVNFKCLSDSQTYFPRLGHIDLIDICALLQHLRVLLRFFESKAVQSGDGNPSTRAPAVMASFASGPHLSVHDCKLAYDSTRLLRLPDVEDLSVHEAVHYLKSHLIEEYST